MLPSREKLLLHMINPFAPQASSPRAWRGYGLAAQLDGGARAPRRHVECRRPSDFPRHYLMTSTEWTGTVTPSLPTAPMISRRKSSRTSAPKGHPLFR